MNSMADPCLRYLLRTLCAGVGACWLIAYMPAQAADDDPGDEVQVTEEVLVTGTRIKRIDNLSSPVPMVSLGEDQIE